MVRAVFLVLVMLLLPAEINWSLASDDFEKKRYEMVERDIAGRGVKDGKVLATMRKVQRHLFVDEKQRGMAYEDHPLPIGEGQTISQPYIVAMMTEALALKGDERVLEIGTGSGYQAAVLSDLVKDVYTIEIRKELCDKAVERLRRLGYRNVHVKHDDGYFGWEAYAPFDAIIVTASANHIPPPLLSQLKEGGRLIIPVGSTVFYQNLTLVKKQKDKHLIKELGPVVFVSMTGAVQKQ
jgi:protein-L-isoaspartate(D-aspartate) O-methyltransferase